MTDDASDAPISTEAPPAPEHGSDFKGLQDAGNELHQQRERRGETEPPPKQREVEGDEEFKDARAASKVVDRQRRGEAADTLWTTTEPAVAERAGRKAFGAGDEPRVVKAPVGDQVIVQDPNGVQRITADERLTARQGAEALVRDRTEVAPVDEHDRAQGFKDLQIQNMVEVYGVETVNKMMGGEQAEQPAPVQEQPAQEQQPQPEPPQVDPVAQARAQADYERQAYAYARQASQAEVLIDAQAQQLVRQHQAEFPDVKTWDDVQNLNPQQKQRWANYAAAMDQLVAQHKQAAQQRGIVEHQIDQARRAQESAEFHQWKTAQDALAAKSIPELADAVTRVEITEAANKVLDEAGLTREVESRAHPAVRRAIRSAAFQTIVAKAARFDLAQKRANEVSAKSLPQPQRPGVRQERGERGAADVAHLSERVNRAKAGSENQLRLAARLIATNRANRGR